MHEPLDHDHDTAATARPVPADSAGRPAVTEQSGHAGRPAQNLKSGHVARPDRPQQAGDDARPDHAEPEQPGAVRSGAAPDGRRLPPRDPDELAEELLRRRYAVSRRAAARTGLAVVAFTVLALLAGIGLQQASAVPAPPADRPGAASATFPPRTPAADDPGKVPTATAVAPATLDADGVIHHPDGRGPAARIPLPAGSTAVDAVRVTAGWVVRTVTGDPLAMHVTSFLGGDGRLRDFAPRLVGAQTAFRADGRAMAAYLHPRLYVFELPSGRELTRLDVRTAERGNQVHDMWLTADWLLVSWGVLEGAHPGAITGLAVYDLATGTATVHPELLVADVADDGTALLLDGPGCVRVAHLGRTGLRARERVCLPGRTVLRAALSPHGTLVALSLSTREVPAREGRLGVYLTADLAAGRVAERAGGDGRLRVVGWSSPTRLLAVDDGRERLDEVLTCTSTGCDVLPLDGVRVAVMPAYLP